MHVARPLSLEGQPDISLDVDSANPLGYHTQNRGASQLEEVMSDLKLC